MSVREPDVGQLEVRVHFKRALKIHDSLAGIRLRSPIHQVPPRQKQVISANVACSGVDQRLRTNQLNLQGINGRARDFVLDREHGVEPSIKAV